MKNNKQENAFISFLRTQAYFLKIIYNEHPKSITIYVIVTLITSMAPSLLIVLNKMIIDTISVLPSQTDTYRYIIMLLFILFIIQYTSALLKNILDYIFLRITLTVNIVLQKLINFKLVKMPLEEYEDNLFFDNVNLANVAIRGNGIQVVSSAVSVIGSIASLLGIIGILISIHWTMPLALFLSTLPGIVLIFIAKIKKYQLSKVTSPVERELAFTNGLFMNKSSIKEIKIYDLGDFLITKWSKISQSIQTSKLRLAMWEAKTKSLAVLILQLSSFGVSILLVSQIHTGSLSIGSYVALLGAVTTVQSIFGSIGASVGSIFETAIYNNALINIINYESKKILIQEKIELNNVNEINTITLDNISFTYPKTNQTALDRITLFIKKGEKISIVGSNGSGKTTLVNCLMGLYDVSEGKVFVNDIDINLINRESYFANISAVFQDFNRYKFAVRENIGFGNLSKLNTDESLYDMLEKVNLYDKVLGFPNGLETYLTKEFTGGTELSGGEWQRIALARAFFKEAELIVLDEPTSALDPITELNTFNLFHQLASNKTTITISHRIGPTKFSDRIIVMDNGQIKEQGNFTELMKNKGLYYDMYKSQSQLYEN